MATIERVPITDELLTKITSDIVGHFHPEKVILFGSYAWGTPHQDSDVDLLVIMDSALRPARRSVEVSMACRPRFVAMDVLVRTPAEVEHRLAVGDPFIHRIIERGRTLYAR